MICIKFKKLDDEMHFWAGVLIMFFVFLSATFLVSQTVAALIGFGVASLAAIGKELYDKHIKKTRFDWRDVLWTLIGASIPAMIFVVADILYHYSS